MTEIITWNVQAGLGVDGINSLERIARVIQEFGDPDVICLQEISRYMPDNDGGRDIDQVAALTGLFPSHAPAFGPALNLAADTASRRRCFGNLILSRLPVVQIFLHALPQPADPGVKHMPRQATEVIVDGGSRTLRITTTHLEFHSESQRLAQVGALRSVHEEICTNALHPGHDPGAGIYTLRSRPCSAVLCGDYNFTPACAAYAKMLAPFETDTPVLMDAWAASQNNRPHAPTCGVFDRRQWPQGAHCRDFFFVTPDLIPRIESLTVAVDTNASDHQPMRLVLSEN